MAPNATVCYNIPSTDICPYGIRFLWPRAHSEFSCSCPVHNSSDGNTVFNDCIPCESEITPQFLENGSICFSAPRNETVVHFECSNNELCIFECSGEQPCIESECFIRTVLASHKVITSGKQPCWITKGANLIIKLTSCLLMYASGEYNYV